MRRLPRLSFLALVLLPLSLSPAYSAVTLSSSAYGASVNIAAGGVVQANALFGAAAGTADPAYNQSGGVASINHNATVASNILNAASETLQSGVVTSSASSGGVNSNAATATTALNNVSFGFNNQLLSTLALNGLLNLGIGTLTSSTTVGIGASGFYGTGSSLISGLNITGSLLSASIDGSLYANAAANTVLLSLAGLKVVLNEQISSQNMSSLAMQTNAVHIALSNYAIDGSLLNGDVILGHSQAEVGGVPEPATWGMMIVGLGAVGASLRRKRATTLLA
jgi:hypothetical protein